MSQEDDFYALITQIQAQYPDIFALINQPGVLPAALDIINARMSGTPMTQEQINARLHNTPFWLNTPEAGRKWWAAVATDPASANQLKEQRATQIEQWVNQQGLGITHDQAMYVASVGLARGYDEGQWKADLLQNFYTQLLQQAPGGAGTSPTGDALQKAAADMGVPISPMTQLTWQKQIMLGQTDMNTFQSYLTEQAKSLYPGLADAIDAGITVRQYADPYAQIASKELGINPADFNLTDPKWSSALQQKDPKTGANTAMTLQSWQSHIRSDPTYGYDTTTGARDQAAQFATQLATQFGAMA